MLDAFAERLQMVNDGRYDEIKAEYMSNLYRRIGSYGYLDKDGEFYARVEDVDNNGHLILRRDNGTLSEYEFKELKFI